MGHPETNAKAPDWILSSIHDRGPGAYYRYRVTGINLNFDPPARISWDIPDSPTSGPSAHRYDVTLATWKIDCWLGLDTVPESIASDLIDAIARLDILSERARFLGARALDDLYAIDLVIAGRSDAETVHHFRIAAPPRGVDPDRAIAEARLAVAYARARGRIS